MRDREGGKSRKLKEKEKESIPDAPILLGDGRGRLVPPCGSGRRARSYAWASLLRLQEGVRAGTVAGPRRGPLALVRRGAGAPCGSRRAGGEGCRGGLAVPGLSRGGLLRGARRWSAMPGHAYAFAAGASRADVP